MRSAANLQLQLNARKKQQQTKETAHSLQQKREGPVALSLLLEAASVHHRLSPFNLYQPHLLFFSVQCGFVFGFVLQKQHNIIYIFYITIILYCIIIILRYFRIVLFYYYIVLYLTSVGVVAAPHVRDQLCCCSSTLLLLQLLVDAAALLSSSNNCCNKIQSSFSRSSKETYSKHCIHKCIIKTDKQQNEDATMGLRVLRGAAAAAVHVGFL